MKYDKCYRVCKVHIDENGNPDCVSIGVIGNRTLSYEEATQLAHETTADTGETTVVFGVFEEFAPEKPKPKIEVKRIKFVE